METNIPNHPTWLIKVAILTNGELYRELSRKLEDAIRAHIDARQHGKLDEPHSPAELLMRHIRDELLESAPDGKLFTKLFNWVLESVDWDSIVESLLVEQRLREIWNTTIRLPNA